MIVDYYSTLIDQTSESFRTLQSKHESFVEFKKAHNHIHDYNIVISSLSNNSELKIFEMATKEYQLALCSLAAGMYRNAHMSLRLFFELSLASVYFSAHEIALRQWFQNVQDIKWSLLVDDNNGVFSNSFIAAFGTGLDRYGKHYSSLAQQTYRECSEYVHGNFHTHKSDPNFCFDEVTMLSWIQRAEAVRISVLFACVARYGEILPNPESVEFAALAIDNFGHLPPIRDRLC